MKRFLLISLFLPAICFATPRDTSIRLTDWKKYFRESKEFTADPSPTSKYRIYYTLINPKINKDDLRYGAPDFDNIWYGDLDGDGKEEAVIFFESGGTIGAVLLAVFSETSNGPHLLDWKEPSMFKGFEGEIRHDTLLVYGNLYIGWEGDCCPSGMSTRFYNLKNKKLVLVKIVEEGIPKSAKNTAELFYGLLSDRNYKEAYIFLGKKFRSKHPYKRFVEGYKNTISIKAQFDTLQVSDNTIHVYITSTDRQKEGTPIISEYEGTWKMYWANSEDGWLLDEPKIKKIK